MTRIHFLLLVVLAFAPEVNATERVRVGEGSDGSVHLQVTYDEDGIWRVDEFVIPRGKLQSLVSRREFNAYWKAAAYAEEKSGFLESSAVSAAAHFGAKLVTTEVDTQVIWPVTAQWDEEWESKYSLWVKGSFTPDFLKDHGIQVDCADVPIAARWIFSRINGLPAGQQLAGSGVLFTQDSFRNAWEKLPRSENWAQDQVFMAAINYVLENTYTYSLDRDSYPIEISERSMRPGVHHLELRGNSGHTFLVNYVSVRSGIPIQVIWATTPRILRTLTTTGYLQIKQPKDEGGFLRMRWPRLENGKWKLVEGSSMPFYSLEQYTPEFMRGRANFWEAVFRKLSPNLDYRGLFHAAMSSFQALVTDRIDIVRQGFEFCQSRDCSPGTQAYEDWSTPSRDKRVLEQVEMAEDFVRYLDEDAEKEWKNKLKEAAVELDGVVYPLGAVIHAWRNHSYDPDPRSSIQTRWGLSGASFAADVFRKSETGLKERNLQIENTSQLCKDLASCAPGSENWLRASTFQWDQLIQSQPGRLDRYCDYAPESQCSILRSELTRTITVGGRSRTLGGWIEFSHWLNSDGRAPLAHRWGEHRKGFRTVSYYANNGDRSPYLTGVFSREDVSENGREFYVDLVSETVLPLEHRGLSYDFNYFNGSLSLKDATPGAYWIYRPGNALPTRVDTGFSDSAEASWVSREILAVTDQGISRFLDTRSRSLAFTDPIALDPNGYSREGLASDFIASDFNELVSVNGQEVKRTTIQWPEGADPASSLWPITSNESFVFATAHWSVGGDDDRKTRLVAIERTSGKLSFPLGADLEISESRAWGAKKGQWIFVGLPSGQTIACKFGPRLEVLSTYTFDGSTSEAWAHDRYLAVYPSDRRGTEVYRFTETGFEKIPLLADESHLDFWARGAGDLALYRTKDDKFRIRRIENPRAIFESKDRIYIEGSDWVRAPLDGGSYGLFDLRKSETTPLMTFASDLGWSEFYGGLQDSRDVGFAVSGRFRVWFIEAPAGMGPRTHAKYAR